LIISIFVSDNEESMIFLQIHKDEIIIDIFKL